MPKGAHCSPDVGAQLHRDIPVSPSADRETSIADNSAVKKPLLLRWMDSAERTLSTSIIA